MPARIQLAFDLDTNKLKDVYTSMTGKEYTRAYYEIRAFLKVRGYEHKQGSVYHSIEPKTRFSLLLDIKLLQRKMPWFAQCVTKLDYGELQKLHDLLPELKKQINRKQAEEMEKELSLFEGKELFKPNNKYHQPYQEKEVPHPSRRH